MYRVICLGVSSIKRHRQNLRFYCLLFNLTNTMGRYHLQIIKSSNNPVTRTVLWAKQMNIINMNMMNMEALVIHFTFRTLLCENNYNYVDRLTFCMYFQFRRDNETLQIWHHYGWKLKGKCYKSTCEQHFITLKASISALMTVVYTHIILQWCHNERDCVSNHRRLDALRNRLFRRRSKKPSKLRVTGLFEGNSPVTGEFPSQRASDAENVFIWWRHHANFCCAPTLPWISSNISVI